MNRKRNQRLLAATTTVAGLAIGASIAMAAHPPVPLYTYEEIAMQYGFSDGRMPVMIDPVSKQGFPYSPKQTCGTAGCHVKNGVDYTYDKISDHSFHSAQGRNEMMDIMKDSNGNLGAYGQFVDKFKPWNFTGAMFGKWCPPSLYQVPNFMDQNPLNATVIDKVTGQSRPYSTADNGQPKAYPITNKLYDTKADFIKAVDIGIWEYANNCGSCHVGGGFAEKDRNGVRLSQKQPDPSGKYDAYLFYVEPEFDPITGAKTAENVKMAPWLYPMYNNNNPVNGPMMAPNGWGSTTMGNGIVNGQLMMPNVREMDCLICHADGGWSNMMTSVMVYSGMFSMAPMASVGFMDMNQMSPTYQGYSPAKLTFTNYSSAQTGNKQLVSLASPATLINKRPNKENCIQCHAPTTLKDMPDMMRDFLAAAPMMYTGNQAKSPFNGLEMPSFDFNAPFGTTWDWQYGQYGISPVLSFSPTTGMSATPGGGAFTIMIASIGFPSAMGPTIYNTTPGFGGTLLGQGDFGGGNKAGTGPLYFEKIAGYNGMMPIMDQNSLKKGYIPFPRADWFKRGDKWDNAGDDIHISFGCVGCHMDTNTAKVDQFDTNGNATFDGKSLCDPGRGHDWISGTEGGSYVTTTNSRNTVKRCENCHVTGKNSDGRTIETFGAPLATTAHAKYGLTANMTQAVKLTMSNGKPVETPFVGNHLDVVECTVCHVQKKSMVVRDLDSTTGMRYPNMVGFEYQKGVLAMFTDPTPMMHNDLVEWQPLYGWSRLGNGDKLNVDGSLNADWRRKVYPINMITAALWNNTDTTVDANGDGFNGAGGFGTAKQGTKDYTHDGITDLNTTFYDPWLNRELKPYMNFMPGPFAQIPVGFGGTTGDPAIDKYASTYNANGTLNTSWAYVGIYGGNVVFTQPDEIAQYKRMRGPSFAKSELLYAGTPFMVTHGVKSTLNFVIGKNCSDCHAPNKGFFDGGFHMIGSAVKTVGTANMMMLGAELVTVKANPGDIRTMTDMTTKAGRLAEVSFQETIVENGSTLVQTTPLDRFKALYPDEPAAAFVKVTGEAVANSDAWKAYMLSLSAQSAFGIGINPVAVINPITDTDLSRPGIQVATGSLNLTAQQAQPSGISNYLWYYTDGSKDANGNLIRTTIGTTQNVTANLTAGTKIITLEVIDEEGKFATAMTTVEAVAPGIGIAVADGTANVGVVESFNFTNLPTPNNSVKISWGDGMTQTFIGTDVASLTKTHKYASTGTKKITVNVYVNGIDPATGSSIQTLQGSTFKNITVQ